MTTHFTNPIHLYRSLLRETTYLFDPHVRSYIHQYVTGSFRAKSTKPKSKAGSSRPPQHQDAGHLPSLYERRQLKRGRKFLSTLQRANQGYFTPLSNVTKLAYGRIGPKRRELMTAITAKDSETDSETKKMLLDAMQGDDQATPINKSGEPWAPPARVFALIQSQIRVQSNVDPKHRISTQPEIPAENKKGLPMPSSRVKNMTKLWYKKTLTSLSPYLGEQEWNILRDRATGKGFIFHDRRTTATVPVFNVDNSEVHPDVSRLLQGVVKPRGKKLRSVMKNPHKLRMRFIKRMYTSFVLRTAPKAVASDQGGGMLTLHWDCGENRLPSVTKLLPGEQNDLLFGTR